MWPWLAEAALVAAVIGLVLPWFKPLAAQDSGRDARFAAASVAVRALPAPVLPDLCVAYGAMVEDIVRERLCDRIEAPSVGLAVDRLPAVLMRARVRANQAFLAPLQDAEARILELRQQQREAPGDVLALGHAIDAVVADVQPFIERYAMERPGEGPRPLTCAVDLVQSALADSSGRPTVARDTIRANAIVLLGAAFDAHPATAGLASMATLPGARPSPRCAGLDTAAALTAAATLMADARSAPVALMKNQAMRTLLDTAGWQWAAWAIMGLALLHMSRRRVSPTVGVACALAAWAAAAWVCRVPWPLGARDTFVLARESASLHVLPANFVLWMLGAAVCLLLASSRKVVANAPQIAGSMLAYPGLVLATGVGWLVLLDLSANGHYSNRYLALYHQGHLWLAMLTFGIVAFVRQPLGRGLAWMLSLIDGIASRVAARVGTVVGALLLLIIAALLVVIIALVLLNVRQLTSEIGRLWLIIGAAWFFFLRGTPLTERLARSGNSLGSLLRYVWPLLFVVVVLAGAMLITRDMGPLLIAAYAAGAFVAASVAMWRHQRSGAIGRAYALAILLFAAWIAGTTLALFRLGSIDEVTAARLENAAAPLASANDHLALVTWFQRAAPPIGFGPGAVPWCGFGASGACAGVPAQIQSDYTFTALVGTFGWTVAWLLTLGCAVWLYSVLRAHGRATRGEPRLVRVGGRMANDEQAFLSWLGVGWVVLTLCQLAVTVAGNLAVIPLTGVTFPFVSFGMASLVVNTAMLALAVNVNATDTTSRG